MLSNTSRESPLEIAYVFLAAETSEMITGTSLVDGGWTAK